jgi:hypothetical protein
MENGFGMVNNLSNNKVDKILDKMENIFGVRALTVQNEFLELEVTKITPLSYRVVLSLLVQLAGQKEKMPIEEESITDEGSEYLKELKQSMDRLEIECKRIVKSEKGIDVWQDIILTKLNELKVQYETEDSIIELERMNKNILILDDFFVYEGVKKPYDVRIFSYDDLNIVFKMIEKEQHKINLRNMYGR